MPKSTSGSRDRSDGDGYDEPYNKTNGGSGDGHSDRSKTKKRRNRHEDDDVEGAADEFGRSSAAHHRNNKRRHLLLLRDDDVESAQVVDNEICCQTFASMNLKPTLLRGIYSHGFEKPSAIQQRAVRPIVRGRDVIAQSQSGTGECVVVVRLVCIYLRGVSDGGGEKIWCFIRLREVQQNIYVVCYTHTFR